MNIGEEQREVYIIPDDIPVFEPIPETDPAEEPEPVGAPA